MTIAYFCSMTLEEASREAQAQLRSLYDSREAALIADWLLEDLTGLGKSQRLIRREEQLSPGISKEWQEKMQQLLRHRPIQYVLGYAWFMGMKFRVNEAVLIPRPETEELAHWILEDFPGRPPGFAILDAGCGSGCLAIALKKNWPGADIMAADLSEEALEVAAENAQTLHTEISFLPIDLLRPETWQQLPALELMVSNPPYIPLSEAASLDPHVREYEPREALFVEGNDPLLFYRALAQLGQEKLTENGRLYLELHADYGQAVLNVFTDAGYRDCTLRKDLQGKDRMCRIIK